MCFKVCNLPLVGLLVLVLVAYGKSSPFGPKYPVTASWFRDRFTYQDWNRTLAEFQEQGGDSVFLRAPQLVKRTREDLMNDADFAWCGSSNSSTGATGTHCYDEAMEELGHMGLNVTAVVTYEYEEGFSEAIMLCPQVDRKINSSRLYYRIVLPAAKMDEAKLCDFPNGTEVVVVLTAFAGTDPHDLLMTVASDRNMSVYFGLPAAPRATDHCPVQRDAYPSRAFFYSPRGNNQENTFDNSLMEAYYSWVYRVLREHRARYSKVKVRPGSNYDPLPSTSTLYNKTLRGYYAADEVSLAQVNTDTSMVSLYTRLGTLVHGQPGKKLTVSSSIDLNRSLFNATLQQHVQGFEALATTGQIDVIAVKEGRGSGRGCYYWPTQRNKSINAVDKSLDQVLHYLQPHLKENVTFGQVFSASNQELFAALERSHDALTVSQKASFEFWLIVEAFEYLRDDPCLPVDPASSGNGEMLNRASKSRVDRALTVASAKVQKVMSFAWDPDFTCTTTRFKSSMAAQIRASARMPLIADCSFHSPANRSIVVIGYNLDGIGQGFEINWPSRGKRQVNHLYGYYFELDWGVQHNRVPSLEYTQLYDLPNVLASLDDKGWVSVKSQDSNSVCVFEYDFTRTPLPRRYGSFRHHGHYRR